MIRRRELGFAMTIVALFCAAPTPGDVGGCGKTAAEMSQEDYSYSRKLVDCDRCRTCGVTTDRCKQACDGPIEGYVKFPVTCRPLVHDGDVCIRAVRYASCDDFARYVADVAPETPSECDFCRVPEGAIAPLSDAGSAE